jgi:hypothetical protein
MRVTQEIKKSPRTPVTVVLSDRETIRQPDSFRACPLGIQFYSPRPLPEFEVLEFVIAVPNGAKASKDIECSGVVVHCRKSEQKGSDSYRIWVKFIDLAETHRKRIQCMARTSDSLCPYCENFS